MIRLIVVCEGEAEQGFCENLLAPYLLGKGICIECPTIKKTDVGICSWGALKKQLIGHLNENAYVTTLVDFYGIKDNLCFPGWEASKEITDKGERVAFLEQEMKSDVDERYRPYFLPYMQLHEFESLLFRGVEAFEI